MQEKRLISKFFDEISQDSGKHTSGVKVSLKLRPQCLFTEKDCLLDCSRHLVQLHTQGNPVSRGSPAPPCRTRWRAWTWARWTR